MPNLIMIDFESNSGRVTGGADILTVSQLIYSCKAIRDSWKNFLVSTK